ncbi:uncharacterized protein LOC125498848 [Beta vulgaris subsp. vulgaris]|uniref:uncharacterized protein LOC125498848 n=1 Tax=Beta vulgaris subsp. vulgaris TaxID=3555 RepID=UPI002036B8D0|nr:uncharacterized protein LOC125498848 [Beta vulgaris subsp. vulgaris]
MASRNDAPVKKIFNVSDLVKETKYITIEVRIIRVYEKPNFMNNLEAGRIEMILLDVHGTKIHANFQRNLIVAFWPKIEEGGFRQISNFPSHDNGGYELTTQHKFTISMNYGLSIVDCNPLDIPLYGFEFVPFGDILAKKDSDVYLIDIIGQLTAYGELTKTAKSKCMTIELVETKNDNITCVLWGTYADKMINYINAEGANGAIIVILQFAKRIMYKGGQRVIFKAQELAFQYWIEADLF